jgi:hypothetical protein
LKLELGPNSVDRGTNHLKVTGTRKFIIENDPGASDYLNAVQSIWFVESGHTTSSDSINAHISTDISDDARVTFVPLTISSTACSGVPSGAYIPPSEVSLEEETLSSAPIAVVSRDTPTETVLDRPRPSPTADLTEIPFAVSGLFPQRGSLEIYGVDGRLVRRLFKRDLAPGYYRESWDGRDGGGRRVAAGIYFVRLEVGNFSKTEKLVRMK